MVGEKEPREQFRATVEELRSAIDHGDERDKVAFPDPAAAPLGADSEAGGAPPSAEMVTEAIGEGMTRVEPGEFPGVSRNEDDADGGVIIPWRLLAGGALAFGLSGGIFVALRFG